MVHPLVLLAPLPYKVIVECRCCASEARTWYDVKVATPLQLQRVMKLINGQARRIRHFYNVIQRPRSVGT